MPVSYAYMIFAAIFAFGRINLTFPPVGGLFEMLMFFDIG
jgi:hypothetical protein